MLTLQTWFCIWAQLEVNEPFKFVDLMISYVVVYLLVLLAVAAPHFRTMPLDTWIKLTYDIHQGYPGYQRFWQHIGRCTFDECVLLFVRVSSILRIK